MDKCEFCQERKVINCDITGGTIQLSRSGDVLMFDNSADEYAEGRININYCPICGREL